MLVFVLLGLQVLDTVLLFRLMKKVALLLFRIKFSIFRQRKRLQLQRGHNQKRKNMIINFING